MRKLNQTEEKVLREISHGDPWVRGQLSAEYKETLKALKKLKLAESYDRSVRITKLGQAVITAIDEG